MKKYLLLATGIMALSSGAFAQKAKIQDATEYLDEYDLSKKSPTREKAIVAINEAVANESTKTSARAWAVRGRAYMAKALDSTANSPDAADIAIESFKKSIELDPKFEPDQVDNPLYGLAILSFNNGVKAYGAKDYNAAYTNFNKVSQIYNMGSGKRFAANKQFTSMIANAKSNAAYAAVNNNQYELATPIFEELRSGSGAKDTNVYRTLLQIYSRQKNMDKFSVVMNDARKEFPDNKNFKLEELNYYKTSGKGDEYVNKMEEMLAKDPSNLDMQYDLANAYEAAAFPSDATGQLLPSAPDFSTKYAKAEAAYKKLIAASPTNADYNYNTAIIYYHRATLVNNELRKMNDKKLTPAEEKHSEQLILDRNAYFDQALPYFEVAAKDFEARGSSLTEDDKKTYRGALTGMREIYNRKNNKAKLDEIAKKMNALN